MIHSGAHLDLSAFSSPEVLSCNIVDHGIHEGNMSNGGKLM